MIISLPFSHPSPTTPRFSERQVCTSSCQHWAITVSNSLDFGTLLPFLVSDTLLTTWEPLTPTISASSQALNSESRKHYSAEILFTSHFQGSTRQYHMALFFWRLHPGLETQSLPPLLKTVNPGLMTYSGNPIKNRKHDFSGPPKQKYQTTNTIKISVGENEGWPIPGQIWGRGVG